MQLQGPSRLLLLLLVAAACAVALPATAAAAGSKRPASSENGSPQARASAGKAAGKRDRARQGKRRHTSHSARRRPGRQLRRADRRRLGLSRGKALRQRQDKAKAAAPAENPDVLFRGDFEAGFDGWHVQSLSPRATLLSGGSFQGGGAARFEVADGDVEPETGSERSEVSGPTFDEGQDLYIRDAIRVPGSTSFEGSWQIVQQLHETDWDGSPGIAVFLDEDNALSIGSGDGETTYWEGPEIEHDRWYDLVYRVYLSQDESQGFVEVWLDGAQQTVEDGGTRAYGETIQTSQTYIKAGIYRSKSSEGTSLVEHDGIVVATSLAAATS